MKLRLKTVLIFILFFFVFFVFDVASEAATPKEALLQFLRYRARGFKAQLDSDIKNAYTAAMAYLSDNPDKTVTTMEQLQNAGFQPSHNIVLVHADMSASSGKIVLRNTRLEVMGVDNEDTATFDGIVTLVKNPTPTDDELIATFEKGNAQCKNIAEYIAEGDKLLDRSPVRAENSYRKALKVCPESIDAVYALAVSLYSQHKDAQGDEVWVKFLSSLDGVGQDIEHIEPSKKMKELASVFIGWKINLTRGKAILDQLLKIYPDDHDLRELAVLAMIEGNSSQAASAKEDIDINDIPDFESNPRENDLAVVIGIENYRNLPKSDFSRSDAEIMKDYLKALGFKDRNIELLTDEKATFTDIKKSVERWLPNRAKADSTVVIYYSGHGAPDPETGEAYLVPFEGDPNYLSDSGYAIKRLADSLGKVRAKQVLILLDSCFSGSGGRSVLAKGARPIVLSNEGLVLKENVALITATKGDQISTSSPDKGHGVFTYYFLKALKNGKTDLAEIYSYIKPQIEDEAKSLNVEQTPSINPAPEKLKGRFSLVK